MTALWTPPALWKAQGKLRSPAPKADLSMMKTAPTEPRRGPAVTPSGGLAEAEASRLMLSLANSSMRQPAGNLTTGHTDAHTQRAPPVPHTHTNTHTYIQTHTHSRCRPAPNYSGDRHSLLCGQRPGGWWWWWGGESKVSRVGVRGRSETKTLRAWETSCGTRRDLFFLL